MEQFPISGGILPMSQSLEGKRESISFHFPSQGGNIPESSFSSAENSQIGSSESSRGNVPVNELKESINVFKFLHFPISAVMEPLSSV